MHRFLQMAGNFKINKWLYPLAWIYSLIITLRNKLFDWGILPSEVFPVPVISVGNITVGGTGKTPHTEYLIDLLREKYRVAVLSRGYKRKTKGFILADENSNSDLIGDEPFQIYKKFPSTIVAVDANRRRGIRNLLNLPENQKPDVILLDDAFQHRYVKPSLSILLSDINRPFYDDYLLPAGRLRENPNNYKRADFIIYTKCPESYTSDDYRIQTEKLNLQPHQQLFFSSYRYKNLLPVFPEVNSEPDRLELRPRNDVEILLVAGLANPSGLIEYVKKYFSDFQTIVFPDHHEFSYKDIQTMMNFIKNSDGKNKRIITSEKDAMRLVNNPFVPDEMKSFVYYLPIEVNILFDDNLFKQKIENHVANFKRNGILA